jgi:predicted permease
MSVIGRLKTGVTQEAATAELSARAVRVQDASRDPRGRVGVRIAPLTHVVLGPISRSLWMLFAAVGLVLAAACANVANLLLSRMPVRTREVVTRAALGASPRRLVRQFLTESLLLALAGGIGGVVIAWQGSALLVARASAVIPRAHEVAVDWRVFSFLLVICLATAGLFGLAPALAAARVDVAEGTRSSGGHATMGGAYGRIRDGLVVVEVALAFLLALGAAVVLREVVQLRNTDTGMAIENVLTLHLTPRATAQDYYSIEDRIARLPGVAGAGFTQLVPLQNWGWDADFAIRGRPANRSEPSRAELRYVTPGYFRAVGIPVLRGRGFLLSDSADAPRVILINDALARQYFGSDDPVGVDLDRGTIVGVVGSVRQVALDRPAKPEIYYPAAQNVTMAPDTGMSLMVRSVGRSEYPADAIRAAVREVNPHLAIFNVKTMQQVLTDSLWELHLYLWLIGLFAILTVVLAAIGLYGVISYNVTSRTREFAVRLALGSEAAGLMRLVVSRGVRLAGAGLTVGVVTALALVVLVPGLPVARSLGPAVYLGVSTSLFGLALLACVIPALRVAGVNPATALRQD